MLSDGRVQFFSFFIFFFFDEIAFFFDQFPGFSGNKLARYWRPEEEEREKYNEEVTVKLKEIETNGCADIPTEISNILQTAASNCLKKKP